MPLSHARSTVGALRFLHVRALQVRANFHQTFDTGALWDRDKRFIFWV